MVHDEECLAAYGYMVAYQARATAPIAITYDPFRLEGVGAGSGGGSFIVTVREEWSRTERR
jgi:hypothetical protein